MQGAGQTKRAVSGGIAMTRHVHDGAAVVAQGESFGGMKDREC
jgi:hypothetical protein